MRKLQIDGVGTVEVDPNFDSLSPEEQEATVNDIIAQHQAKQAPKGNTPAPRSDQVVTTEAQGGFLTGTPTQDAGPPKRSVFTPEEEANIGAFVEDSLKRGTLTPESYQQFLQDLSGGELGSPDPAADVANFQKFGWGGTKYFDTATKNEANETPPKEEQYNDAATFGLAAADGAALNFGTEIVSGAEALADNPLNFWPAFQRKYNANAQQWLQRQQEDPLLAFTGNLVGSVATPTAKIFKGNPGPKVGAIEGGVYGTASGIGAGEGSLYDRMDEGLTGLIIGAGGGAAAGKLATRSTKDRRDNLWLDKQVAENPYAAYDAEIAQDVAILSKGTAKSPTDPKGRAPVTIKEVNNLEQAYVGRFKEKIDKLDIAPSQKLYIKEALDGKHSLDQLNVELLRGTEYGDAVADGITRVQRLRALTPEIASRNIGTMIKRGVEITGALGGATMGSGIDPMYGSALGGAATYGALRLLLQRVGNTEAARVNAAEDLIKKVDRYRKLGERVGPSGADETKQAFDTAVGQKLDEGWMAKKAKEAELAELAKQAEFRKAWFDDAEVTPVSKGGLEKRDKAQSKRVSDLVRKVTALEKVPDKFVRANKEVYAPKPPKVKEPSAKDKVINAQIEQGLMGTSKTQEAFATRVGVPVPDMLRALDKVAQDVPEFADDIKRIKFNYPTSQRGLADILVPRMQKYLNEDGTMEALKTKAAEATAKVEARKKIANPNAAPAPKATARSAEGDMVGISRPEQWNAAKDQFQAQANESINRLFSSDEIKDETLKIIGNAPEVIRDNYRTIAEAERYIKEVVMPDLEIAGVDPSEQATIKALLLEVASAKRHKDEAALEAALKKKQ